MRYLTAAQIVAIHEKVISPNELQGQSPDRSIESVVARVENRLAYGMIADTYELAACYLCYIAVAYCFNDANKRTAHTTMQLVLKLNGVEIDYDVETMGDKVIQAAQGQIEDFEFASYSRSVTI